MVAQAPKFPQLGPERDGEVGNHDHCYAPGYPRCFEGPTWLHRLQRFPNLALNPMERFGTMSIEFYGPIYPRDGVLGP